MSDPFDKLVDDARAVFDASASKPLRDAWGGLDLPQVRQDLIARFADAGIVDAEIDARYLLAHVLSPASYADAVADPALCSWQRISLLADLAWERLKRKPMAQVLGSQPFWTLDLLVSEDTLTPRADTETLVESVLKTCGQEAAQLVDLGTGSGAILLALLSERPDWRGLGIDLSPAALEVAQHNALRCGLDDRAHFIEGRWGTGLADQSVDILVSNPPYITSEVLAGLEPEVRVHEPKLALDGGTDGLDAYREICADILRLLRPGGWLAFEIGYDQAKAVSDLLEVTGLVAITTVKDLAGHDRVVMAQTPVK